jgi:hypothetical protein
MGHEPLPASPSGIGFGFTKPAYDEVARIQRESNIEILLMPIQEFVAANPPVAIL